MAETKWRKVFYSTKFEVFIFICQELRTFDWQAFTCIKLLSYTFFWLCEFLSLPSFVIQLFFTFIHIHEHEHDWQNFGRRTDRNLINWDFYWFRKKFLKKNQNFEFLNFDIFEADLLKKKTTTWVQVKPLEAQPQ